MRIYTFSSIFYILVFITEPLYDRRSIGPVDTRPSDVVLLFILLSVTIGVLLLFFSLTVVPDVGFDFLLLLLNHGRHIDRQRHPCTPDGGCESSGPM